MKLSHPAKCKLIHLDSQYQYDVMSDILLNIRLFIFVSLQYHSAPAAYDTVLKHLNTAFTVLFSMECVLKIMAFGLVVSIMTPNKSKMNYQFRSCLDELMRNLCVFLLFLQNYFRDTWNIFDFHHRSWQHHGDNCGFTGKILPRRRSFFAPSWT